MSLSDGSKCLSRNTVGDPIQFSFGVENHAHKKDKVPPPKKKEVKWRQQNGKCLDTLKRQQRYN